MSIWFNQLDANHLLPQLHVLVHHQPTHHVDHQSLFHQFHQVHVQALHTVVAVVFNKFADQVQLCEYQVFQAFQLFEPIHHLHQFAQLCQFVQAMLQKTVLLVNAAHQLPHVQPVQPVHIVVAHHDQFQPFPHAEPAVQSLFIIQLFVRVSLTNILYQFVFKKYVLSIVRLL